MGKFTFKNVLMATSILTLSGTSFAQNNSLEDRAPYTQAKPSTNETKALWDIQFNHNVTTAASGDLGMAGSIFFNNEFWVSRWGSDTLYRFSNTGALVSEFTISGLTGVRGLTTDGTYIYASANSTTIYRINPANSTLAAPHIAAPSAARFCTYDATLNAGAGGFWIGNFSTDITAISMTGTTLSSIPAATHGLTGMYGAAVDNFTAGGPFIWIFDQGGASATRLVQLNRTTGAQTGLIHDVMADVGAANSLTSGLAGGCFISNQIVSGQVTLGGIIQGTPANVLFGYQLTTPVLGVSTNELNASNKFYPNPTEGIVTIQAGNAEAFTFTVADMNGRVLQTKIVTGNECQVDMTNLNAGTYLVTLTSGEEKIGQQLIIKK